MFKQILQQIPGFRTGKRWKMGFAIAGYPIMLTILLSVQGITLGDKLIHILQDIVMLGLPYVLLTNIGGIRKKLPLFNKGHWKHTVAGVFAVIALLIGTVGVLANFESPEYKEAQALAAEQAQSQKQQTVEKSSKASDTQEATALNAVGATQGTPAPQGTIAATPLDSSSTPFTGKPSKPQATAAPEKLASQSEQTHRVTRVIDGDTIVINMNGTLETVRLIGIDTPETVDPRKPVQPFGKEASSFTKSQLEGKYVRIELDVQERDKYGRLLAYVYLGNEMFNKVLLREGYAQLMTIPPNVHYADAFTSLQSEARKQGKGLWCISSTPAQSKPTATPVASGGTKDGIWIKGNISSSGEKIYHVPGGAYYSKTIPEEWFKTEADARAAGYRRSKR